ncbi:MAG: DUF1217 domain-containing protein [Pseudomonadota bacterium]
MIPPAIPLGGVAGLKLLDRTFDRQLETFSRSPELQREIDDFLDRAGEVQSAEDLVADRQLLKVALGAFGLEDELPKRALVRTVLEEGTIDPEAIANRLVDPAWGRFAAALGFGDLGNRLGSESVRRQITEDYRVRQFERAVGDIDVDLRLALNFRREIDDIAGSGTVERSGWFRVIGSEPLRLVVLGALNLPESIGALDIDAQVTRLEERAQQVFGGRTPAVFTDPAVVEDAIERFLFSSAAQRAPSATAPGVAALTILQANPLGAAGTANLFASRL